MVKKREEKSEKKQFFHWSDVAAEKVIRERGDKDHYIVESGITPSGMIHLGNFRETITQDLVRRALEKRGKKVTFFYVWDDYDALRKIPANLPKQKLIKENLRKPVSMIPDPYGCHKSYAKHFEKVFEEENKKVGIDATFVYQTEEYLAGKYVEGVRIALAHTDAIRKIINEYRNEPYGEDWLPITLFCDKCKRDTIENLKWIGGYTIKYRCECGHSEAFDFREKPIVKLKWRADWPMRWHVKKVDFESAGKDHFAAGGSITTGYQIQEEVFKSKHPSGFFYEWIGIRGKGQFSSSTGNVVTLTEAFEVYEPEIVRYLFAGSRPNREFAVAFDLGVLNVYEDFDRTERIYYGLEEVNEKKKEKNKVAYELSHIGKISKTMPYQPSFRHLTMLLQINNFDIDKATSYFEKELKNDYDKKRLMQRAECAKNWIQKYAPEELRFKVQEECQVVLAKEEVSILHELADKLVEKDWTDKELHEEMYILCANHEFPTGDFFKLVYRALINKDKGPRLASFILEIGKERVSSLLKKVKEREVVDEGSSDVKQGEYKLIEGTFEIATEVREKFPGLKVGIAIIKGVKVEKSIPELEKFKKEIVGELIEEFKDKDLSDIPSLEEYKRIYKATGVDPTKQKPSPLALLKRVKERKELYTVNTLVDLYNLAVMKTQVSMGAFDLKNLSFPTYLRFAEKGEEFTPLMADKPKIVKEGELVYADNKRLVFCRDLNYRDSDFTKITEETKDTILFVDGTKVTSEKELKDAMELTLKWITKFCGGKVEKIEYTF